MKSKDTPQSYILCTSPRSGSTLLCGLLTATGSCGVPHSYFHTPSLATWLESYDLSEQVFDTRLAALRAVFDAAQAEGTGDTGMFGLRLQRGSFEFFTEQLALLKGHLFNDHVRIEAVFGATKYLYLKREDKLDQAISYIKAQQSGLWHRAPDGTELERLAAHQDPVYDGPAIARQIAAFMAYDREWTTWFEQQGLTPLTLTYDALSDDPKGTLADVLGWLGVERGLAANIDLPVAKLADATSREWAARFQVEYPSLAVRGA